MESFRRKKHMNIKGGIIPTAVGSVVTAAGATLIAKDIAPKISAGVLGFGLAHVVLGSIDLVEKKGRK